MVVDGGMGIILLKPELAILYLGLGQIIYMKLLQLGLSYGDIA